MLKPILILTLAVLGLVGLAYLTLFEDYAYGPHRNQRMDVYAPKGAENAPVILMLHGGGWSGGSRRWPNVWFNKSRHFTNKGYVFVSTGTRLLPEADPLEQVDDLAAAFAYVVENAKSWGGDPDRIILMGHSSGAHVASLLGVQQDLLRAKGLPKPLAIVSLDTAALDVTQGMAGPPRRWLAAIFGEDRALWQRASPAHFMDPEDPPMLVACSTKYSFPCAYAVEFASAHAQVEALSVPYAHRGVNARLGAKNDYTQAVDQWLARLGLP
ncbi:alpha/beta fold hydrolase [Epibacterium sp. SM1969]|uniref:Alpha/beta fold hydrolase n=1 Tax=Tritonibacter aquimaris TaxID=2663379 RepID=A0A844AZU9_9RHOB|nr:alpha/beta hydrolase [Tritonibacter aquimaris]MQY43441.1 alpha/beta fold hydrolase [Tritonibacter aquimaris]